VEVEFAQKIADKQIAHSWSGVVSSKRRGA